MMDTTAPPSRSQMAARAFLTPRKLPSGTAPLMVRGARALSIQTPEGSMAAVDAGHGPAALLVHGWEGQASDLEAVALRLLEVGWRVIVVDLPAHGASAGERTSIPASARALLSLQQQLGALQAVVAHSVGAATAVEAMALGLDVERAVLISAPARYRDYAWAFATRSGLNEAQAQEMLAELRRLGIDIEALSVPGRAPRLRQPALFVHSADDRIVPLSDALDGVRAWPGARLLRVDGLGHRRILRDAGVVEAVVDFLRRPPTSRDPAPADPAFDAVGS